MYENPRRRLRIHTLSTENLRHRLRIHTMSTENPRRRLKIHTLSTENLRHRLRIHTMSTENPRRRLKIQDTVKHGIMVMPEKPSLVSKLILTKLKMRLATQMQHSLQHNSYSIISTWPCKTLENVTIVDIVDDAELQEHPGRTGK